MGDYKYTSKAKMLNTDSQDNLQVNGTDLDQVLDTKKTTLTKVVSEIKQEDRSVIRKKRQLAREERSKKKKVRPLPSVNVMKKRLINFFIKKRKETIKSF